MAHAVQHTLVPLSHPIVRTSHVPTFILAALPTGRTLFIFSGTFPHWWTHHWLHWITLGLLHIRVSLVVEIVKTLPTVQETPVWSLGWEDSLEKGMTTHSSVLAWRIPWTEEPGGLQSMELPMVGCDWVALTLPHLYFKHSLLSLFLFIDRLLKTFFLWLIHSLTLLSDSSQFF